MSKLSVQDTVPPVTMNVVPFKIQYTGDADTQQYFAPSKSAKNSTLCATFRGLNLEGVELPLQKRGFICTASEFLVPGQDGDVQTCRQYSSVAKFDKLTVYGHDAVPPSNSKWRMVHEWDVVADAIHGNPEA